MYPMESMGPAMQHLRDAELLVIKADKCAEDRALVSALHDSKIAIWKAMDQLAEAMRIPAPK